MADVALPVSASEIQSSVPGKDELLLRLDDLLERYLHTLDAYQKAQQQLTKHLSSGYLSLAQANFNNNAHTRYGQDYFDERMQASRKFVICEDEGTTTISVASQNAEDPTDKTKDTSSPADSSATAREAEEVPEADAQGPFEEKTNSAVPETKKTPTNDPLRWFGVLVPPALRSAQASFVTAVEGPVTELSNLLRELRQQEIEIGRVRKQIKKL
ncbi:hypothetical protein DPSP01_005576 [Paraphaeosphaeria sporulosa]|uniref:Vacuolar ATPase assembly protein VMA22 n=1 Tax=Paraphaeosphaeria sporulosa TaxID=1460663 RepID=A0A177CSM9_9PLEO|nr:uncharacterized protein CC84DRAFT_1139180 [Paraphaeosphaeria sporulosa]OAG10533.1 hypothetical protein CC84DRAFT_1139180 [Paraphaeosphaeria sporulosa]